MTIRCILTHITLIDGKIGTGRDVGNAPPLSGGNFEVVCRLYYVDIIGMPSMSVNSVLVIIKSLARIQATAVEGKQRWVGEGWTKGMNDSTVSEQSPKSKELHN